MTTKKEQYKAEGYYWCEHCGESHKVPGYLHTHHIIFRSEVPNHKHLHDTKNKIILCKSCHDWYHTIKSRRNNLIQERGLNELFSKNFIR